MKKLLLWVWACYACTLPLSAQDFTYELDEPQNVEAKIEAALSFLDMSPVTSGILQDRTLPMGSPQLWTSGTAADSIYCHMTQLSIQYEGMYAARLPSNTALATADQAFQTAKNAYQQGSLHKGKQSTTRGAPLEIACDPMPPIAIP